MSATNLSQHLPGLLTSIQQGKIMEAMTEFYDTNAVMQDSANPPTHGLAANIEREKRFLSGVKEWNGFRVVASGGGDNDLLRSGHGLYCDERAAGPYGPGVCCEMAQQEDH